MVPWPWPIFVSCVPQRSRAGMEQDRADNALPGTSCPWILGLSIYFFHLPTFVGKFQPLLFITFSGFNQVVVGWL